MTHDTIEELIDALNRGKRGNRIFLAHLSDNVDFAKVWLEDPVGGVASEGSYNFFFIKNEDALYIGAVLDMDNDLHVFVKESFRKRGYLTSAINEVILPKLYQSGREKQRVTFEDPNFADYCVRNWGFSLSGEREAEKDLSVFAHLPKIVANGNPITIENFEGIRANINRASLYLTMIQEQLEMSYGDSNGLYIEGLISNISSLDDDIEDFIESKKPKKEN